MRRPIDYRDHTPCSSRDRSARRRAGPLAGAVVLFGLLANAREALAYTIETQLTKGCHESISVDALRSVRTSTGWGAPLPYTDPDDGPLVDDLPFSPPDDFKDIGGATLLLGVRDNDIKSLAATSLDQLAQITADSTTQREHCLRSGDEREPDGSARAVADCRAFIKEKLVASLDGLGPDGKPDVNSRDSLTVTLALRGTIAVNVPRFYLRAGQAIHAIQDSFTHTFRDASDQHKISVVLDWIDYADNALNEAADGPPHMIQLDRCDDPDPLRTLKHQLAIEASSAALTIALDPTLSPDAKSVAFDQMLDTFVLYDTAAGCNFGNDWCHAAENQYRPTGCGCTVAGAKGSDLQGVGGAAGFAALAVLSGLAIARRRARQCREVERPIRPVGAAILAVAVLAIPRPALAQEVSPLPTAPEHVAKGPIAAINGESEAAKPGTRDPAGSLFGHLAVAGSYDHAALAFAVGGKYQLSKNWMAGIDVEWNPWIPIDPLAIRTGAGNLYASLVRRYQMAFEAVNFRSTAALGTSTLLINLPGANKWGTGPFMGISFIGIEWKLAPGYFLVVDPTYLVFAVPHITGTPLGYYQYRLQIALEFGG
jgi:hypothetical protein